MKRFILLILFSLIFAGVYLKRVSVEEELLEEASEEDSVEQFAEVAQNSTNNTKATDNKTAPSTKKDDAKVKEEAKKEKKAKEDKEAADKKKKEEEKAAADKKKKEEEDKKKKEEKAKLEKEKADKEKLEKEKKEKQKLDKEKKEKAKKDKKEKEKKEKLEKEKKEKAKKYMEKLEKEKKEKAKKYMENLEKEKKAKAKKDKKEEDKKEKEKLEKEIKEMHEKKIKEKLVKEIRERVEKELKEKLGKEIKEKLEKKEKEKAEKEKKEKIEKEKKEKEEKEKKVKLEKEEKEKKEKELKLIAEKKAQEAAKKKLPKRKMYKKDKCRELSKRAKRAANEAKQLRKQYLIESIKNAEVNEKDQLLKIEMLAKKMDLMRANIISMIEEVRATPYNKREPIMNKIKKALKSLSDLEPLKNQMTREAQKVDQYVITEMQEELDKLIAESKDYEDELSVLNPRIESIKKEIKELKADEKSNPRVGMKLLKKAKKLSAITKRAATIRSDIESLQLQIKHVKAKLDMKRITKIGNDKSDLAIQLEVQLGKVINLDKTFRLKSRKALTTQKLKDVRKVLKVAKEIEKAKRSAEKIKAKIKKAPREDHEKLKIKFEILKKSIKEKKKILREKKRSLGTLTTTDSKLPEEILCEHLEEEIKIEKRKAFLIEQQIRNRCRRNIEKERMLLDYEIRTLEAKLGIAKKAVIDMTTSFKRRETLEDLKEKSQQTLRSALGTKQKKLRVKAEKQLKELIKKMTQVTLKAMNAKAKAMRSKEEIEEKARAQLDEKRKKVLDKQSKLKVQLEKRQKKIKEITDSEKKSLDKIAKEILGKENIKVQKKIENTKKKLDEVTKELKALTLEIEGKRKISKENEVLQDVIKLLQDKIKKKQEESVNQIKGLSTKVKSIVKAKTDELRANKKKILALKKQLDIIDNNTYKEKQKLSINLESTISEMLKIKREFNKKKEELSKLNKEYEKNKLEETKRIAEKISAVKAEGLEKIKAKKKEIQNCHASVKNLEESIISFKKDIELQIIHMKEVKLRGQQLIALNKVKVALIENKKALEKKTKEIKKLVDKACDDIENDEQCNNLNDLLAISINQENEMNEQIEDSIEDFEALLEGRKSLKKMRYKVEESRAHLEIIKAYYGTLDVTEKVAAAVNNSELIISASNKVFMDPMIGQTKTLVVGYRFGDAIPQIAMAKEGTILKIDYKRNQRSYFPPNNTIVIYGAYYGTSDVKSKINAMVSNNQLEIGANNSNFGDPMIGNTKTLVVEYLDTNGIIQMKAIKEGGLLSLGEQPIETTSKNMIITYKPTGMETPDTLFVIGAFYGTSESTIPVLNIQGENNTLSFVPNDTVFPASTEKVNPKTFAMAYRYGKSEPQMIVVAGNTPVKITHQKLPDYVHQADKIVIFKAYYGLVDVTEKVKKLVSNNQTTIKATNEVLDNSNKEGPKTFVVTYQMPAGDLALQLVKEGDSLIIAPPSPPTGSIKTITTKS